MKPFTMTIETEEGHPPLFHPYHLGTIERVARDCVLYQYQCRCLAKLPVVTIALWRDGKIIDVFMGDRWQNDTEEF